MAECEHTTPARPNRRTFPDLVLPRKGPEDGTHHLYVKSGDAFQPAPDAFVIERAQQLIDAHFCMGAKKVMTTAQVIEFLTLHIGHRDDEIFAVMLLTSDRRFIAYEELFQGSVNTAAVEVRRVLASVVRSRAS